MTCDFQKEPRTRAVFTTLAVLSFAFWLAGCAGSSSGSLLVQEISRSWPDEYDEEKIGYVGEFRKERDLFRQRGGWRRLKEFVIGVRDSAMVKPSALALHPDGGIAVSDPGRGLVHLFLWSDKTYQAIGSDLESGLPSPVGVAILPDRSVIVSDSRLERVERFDARGKSLGPFVEEGIISRPAGIAFNDETGEVFIVDVSGHRIFVFDSTGRQLRTLGRRGDKPGEFNFPTHIDLDEQGHLIVMDSLNFRVQLLAPDGTPLHAFGSMGRQYGQFTRPKGVTSFGSGHIAVVEGYFDAINLFTREGTLLLTFGSTGSGPGEFWLPSDVAWDKESNLLFIADSYNSRVQVFRLIDERIPEAP